jgi:hypothetical protein
MVITLGGLVGIGTTSPSQLLQVSQTGGAQIRVDSGASNVVSAIGASGAAGYVGTTSNDSFQFLVNNSEKARLDTSGRLLVGTSTSLDVNAGLQIAVNSSFSDFFPLQMFHFDSTNDASGPTTIYTRSKSDTVGTISAVNVDDGLGVILFRGTGTSNYVNGALIKAEVDAGTVSNTSMPGRLVFSTTADGAASPTERMRIDKDGVLNCLGVYTFTTASAANVVISSGGNFNRSTSSVKYKTDVETVQDLYSDALLQCRPVWYRSTCSNDNPDWGWWGFIAEEVAAIDPRLVHWKTKEVSHDDKGAVVVAPCDPEPEGVQYDRFVPHLLNLIKRQKEQIEAMDARLSALESA